MQAANSLVSIEKTAIDHENGCFSFCKMALSITKSVLHQLSEGVEGR